MRLLIVALVASVAFGGDWDAMKRIPAGRKIEVTRANGERAKCTFVSVSTDALVMRTKMGEQSVPRGEVRRVQVYDPARRVRNGLIWTAVGAAAGTAGGFAICPGCGNEGHGGKFTGPGASIGAGVGALGFFSSSYRTVYRSKP